MSVEVRIVNAEALRVGPADRLIIRVRDLPSDDDAVADQVVRDLSELLVAVGLDGRALVLYGDAELTLVEGVESVSRADIRRQLGFDAP